MKVFFNCRYFFGLFFIGIFWVQTTAPTNHQTLYNFALSLKRSGHLKKAMVIYQQLIELKPTYAHPHYSLALCYLALGDFQNGWKEYEWRWAAHKKIPMQFDKPIWQGENLFNKTILLYTEQGLGDTFQFVRYAKILSAMGAHVIIYAPACLKQILTLQPYINTVICDGDKLPFFDYYCALMSLPFAMQSIQKNIPADIPYLYADPSLVSYWKEKLTADKNFKIGLCWQSNTNFTSYSLRKLAAAKSMQVSQYAPITHIDGVSVYSLQKTNSSTLKSVGPECNIIEFGSDFDQKNGSFCDTAAILKNLDLVITIDTALCHLAGGLGVPVWLLLPNPPDWRWMFNTADTPWYPNMRLFRQVKPGDWKSVINMVLLELQKILAIKRGI